MTTSCILLHGWGLTPRVWEPFQSLLGQREVFAPALQFHADDIGMWADDFASNMSNDSILVGWSLGAILALSLAARHPGKVGKLVLIGASPRFVVGDDWSHGLDAATLQAFRHDFARSPQETLQRFIALQVLGDRERRRVSQALDAARVDSANHFLDDGLRLLAESDVRGCVTKLDLPCLLVHGAQDALMPLAAAQWLHENYPGSQLNVINGAGHAPFLSQPETVAALIREFIHAS